MMVHLYAPIVRMTCSAKYQPPRRRGRAPHASASARAASTEGSGMIGCVVSVPTAADVTGLLIRSATFR